jgi:hypothetical protein
MSFTDLLVGLAGSGKGFLRYRSKKNARQANDFSFAIKSDKRERHIRFRGLYGFLWMNRVGELKSCLFCDDIFAELADGTFMDAWLPEYMSDPSGMNLVISRQPKLSNLMGCLLNDGICEGDLIGPKQIVASQLAVLQKKRKQLPDRQAAALAEEWVPQKRFRDTLNDQRQAINHADEQLKLWRDLRQLLSNYTDTLRNSRLIPVAFLAWLVCLRLSRHLQINATSIYNSRAVFFLQGFHPRTMMRNFIRRILQIKVISI